MPDMTVQPTTSAASPVTSQKAGASASSMLNMNAFLTMFTTQLKYQDPTNPMQSYELAAQLAQFSSVEKLAGIEKGMTDMQAHLSALHNAQMIQAVGKEVTGSSNILQVSEGQITRAGFQINVAASGAAARIRTQSGEVIRTMALGELAAGQHKLEWDGKDDAGQKVHSGVYTFEILAAGSDGKALDVDTSVTGTAYAFRMVEGSPFLVLNHDQGLLIPTSSIQQVNNTAA
ncbi:MAG: hypothetical protein MUF52_16115 [Syntrophobacteraceae bacterium]|jgi:flagellar basal-body rod modification protein FlgD|nr:hypothetical protein [Syntrophobacteraceae bacterium]